MAIANIVFPASTSLQANKVLFHCVSVSLARSRGWFYLYPSGSCCVRISLCLSLSPPFFSSVFCSSFFLLSLFSSYHVFSHFFFVFIFFFFFPFSLFLFFQCHLFFFSFFFLIILSHFYSSLAWLYLCVAFIFFFSIS